MGCGSSTVSAPNTQQMKPHSNDQSVPNFQSNGASTNGPEENGGPLADVTIAADTAAAADAAAAEPQRQEGGVGEASVPSSTAQKAAMAPSAGDPTSVGGASEPADDGQAKESLKASLRSSAKTPISSSRESGMEKASYQVNGEGVPSNKSRQPSIAAPMNNPLIAQLSQDYSKFLVFYTSTIVDGGTPENSSDSAKPSLEIRSFKPHTLDNIKVRKVCEEMIHLQDPSYKIKDDDARKNENFWMSTLRISMGMSVHGLDMRNQLNITVGGYFMLSQMLGFVKSLFSLDLSSNGLKAGEARVLALGLIKNKSIKELRMKGNSIACEGATSMAEVFKCNTTLMLLDLRENSVRSAGVCALTDALSANTTLTHLDVRWNYFGESADFVEQALVDLKAFCTRNRRDALGAYAASVDSSEPASLSLCSSKASIAPPPKGLYTSSLAAQSPELLDLARPIGRVEITVMGARNLPQIMGSSAKSQESYGLPQGYCTCALNKVLVQTKIAAKSYNPVWNDLYEMTVSAIWNVVTVKVKHSSRADHTHRDDATIGMVCIPMGSVINWRGVTNGLEGKFKAIYRSINSLKDPSKMHDFKVCKIKDKTTGMEHDTFDTAQAAARAYDKTAYHTDADEALLNFSGTAGCLGLHVKEGDFPLSGENGVRVLGVQAGVFSQVRLRLKYFAAHTSYLEIFVDRATSLPKMDPGLYGKADPYVIVLLGEYKFRSKVVTNSLNPDFSQSFRIQAPGKGETVQVKIEMWDWDRFDADDYMGCVVVDLDLALIAQHKLDQAYCIMGTEGEGEAAREVNLVNSKGANSELHLRFSYVESDESESEGDEEEHEEEEERQGPAEI